jgi:serine O-acetyltransferase
MICLMLGSDIACRLPESTLMGHPYGIVIHSMARIGENVRIAQNVTIGGKSDRDKGAASVGNDVLIGAGAILLGQISVGDGAVIGAGSIVLKDVPAHATVVGNPARVIRVEGDVR